MRSNKTCEIIFVLGFALLLLTPTCARYWGWDPVKDLNENRILRSAPILSLTPKGWKQFTEGFTGYAEDHFGFRKGIIVLMGTIRSVRLKYTISDLVIMGRDGWLFWGGGENVVDYYRRRDYTPADRARFLTALKDREEWLKAQKIPLQIALTPNSASVYPEMLPNWGMRDSKPKLQQFFELTREVSLRIPVLDLRSALFEGKKNGDVYYKTDSHWDDTGAIIATEALLRQLKNHVPSMPLLDRSRFTKRQERFDGLDLARVLSISGSVEELRDVYQPLPKWVYAVSNSEGRNFSTQCTNCNSARLLIVRDSFGIAMEKYLSTSFSEVRYVWDWELPKEEILQFKPDVVIWQFVERKIF